MEIKPSIGIGDIKFGIKEEDLTSILGTPLEIEEYNYSQENAVADKFYHYENELSFTFDADESFRLTCIDICLGDFLLFGSDLFGESTTDVKNFLNKELTEDPVLEDYSSIEEPDYKLLEYEKAGLNFWFTKGELSCIQVSIQFFDDETIAWPE